MRIFIAILFSPAVKKKIKYMIETIKEKNYHGQETAHDNLHLTMHYLGETKLKKLEDIIYQLQQIKLSLFTIKTNSINVFGKGKRKKILYLSIEDNSILTDLHNEVINQLNSAGYDIEKQEYTPHITLMRRVEIEEDDLNSFEINPFEILVGSISVMESKRIDGKLVYEEIKRISLKK